MYVEVAVGVERVKLRGHLRLLGLGGWTDRKLDGGGRWRCRGGGGEATGTLAMRVYAFRTEVDRVAGQIDGCGREVRGGGDAGVGGEATGIMVT